MLVHRIDVRDGRDVLDDRSVLLLGEPARSPPSVGARSRPPALRPSARSAPISTSDHPPVSRVIEPQEPPPSGAEEDGHGDDAADSLCRTGPAARTPGARPPSPCTSPRRPSTSIHREKSGANGCRCVLGIFEDPPDALGVPFEAEIHPQPSVRGHACSGRGMRETTAAALPRCASTHRSDRARPRPARSARWRTRRLRGRPLRFRPEPPSTQLSAERPPF